MLFGNCNAHKEELTLGLAPFWCHEGTDTLFTDLAETEDNIVLSITHLR